ncbi:zinc finger protein Rlf isoform 1-T1 [Synchiropus picturatus]
MAESNVEPEHEWSDRALDSDSDTLVAMETLLATLRAFEDLLRQQEISITSSTDYCDNFCQALMHYAGIRNSMEHGLSLLEVYCLSINCFAEARSHLTPESDRVPLVLKRLALSCFELFLSVPENHIPYEAWLQFHQSVQIAHTTLIQYGSSDLQALLQITGEGGPWNNMVLSSLLTGQPTTTEDVNAYICLEGEGFMEMRVKHLEKMGELAKAVVLAKACSECSSLTNQTNFRQIFVSLLCQLLPNEEAILEISKLDGKEVLEMTSTLETDGEENTGFILCTTFLTHQLQQQSPHCSWELFQMWSKLQKRIDPSLVSLLERCLQLGAIAKTVNHLLHLVRVIQTETKEFGVAASLELCVKALRLPKQDESEMLIVVCKAVSYLLQEDLEVLRACLLTEFLLGPTQQVFSSLEELYLRPDQKVDEDSTFIPTSLRCELLLALKAFWPFDPEFWDWKTLKHHCVALLSKSRGDTEVNKLETTSPQRPDTHKVGVTDSTLSSTCIDDEQQDEPESKRMKFCCQICKRPLSDSQVVHHSKRHSEEGCHSCPLCLVKYSSRKELIPHINQHLQSHDLRHPNADVKLEPVQTADDDIEPGEIPVDPSLMLYYKTTNDPNVLEHIVQQAKSMKEKQAEDDEHVTLEYIHQNYHFQNRDEYPCPGTGCPRVFKHSKYLYVHLKSEHRGDENVKHFHQMRDKREKCVFCRRHLVSPYHHRKHTKIHYGEQPFLCLVVGCGAQFRSSNELVTHKQIHGFHLNYQCELEGCDITYSDLGQIYHHEAQHFRDAAFTCTSPKCAKFYFSKKEFVAHLSTHNITFTEEDFEAQKKEKQKIVRRAVQAVERPRLSEAQDRANGDVHSFSYPGSCASSVVSEYKERKRTMTMVAVCFDGSKFTCGFEKCGMTFSRARDVQRHLKCAHPEHLKLENKYNSHDRDKGAKASVQSDAGREEKGQNNGSPSQQPAEDEKTEPPETSGANSLSLETVDEILFGLSRLNLSASSREDLTHVDALQPNQNSKSPRVFDTNPTPEKKASEEGSGETLASAKPYVCKHCGFRTAQSYSLLRHYHTMHGYSVADAKQMTSLKDTCFKPYVCQLCSKSHREKHVLRAHYIQVHNFSDDMVNKISCLPIKSEEKTPTNGVQPEAVQPESPNISEEEVPKVESQHEEEKVETAHENGEHLNNSSQSEESEKELDTKEVVAEQKVEDTHDALPQVRTRRLVAKGNLCYILDRFSKPFHCVAKNCDAAFSTQSGLVRHLQLVHHYNRSQLLLENEIDDLYTPEVKKEPTRRRHLPNHDEPQPRYKCHFANCAASYHLNSSLLRHIRDSHSQHKEAIKCKFEGCTRVFLHNDALKKHTLYNHCEYYDSLVVRLQSTHKKSITGCQKKLVLKSQDPKADEASTERVDPEPKGDSQSEDVDQGEEGEQSGSLAKVPVGIVFRSHEEALQLCQDRCLRVAYPCLVQDCDSVVMWRRSLKRHYRRCHRIGATFVNENEGQLILNAEQLEELIQKKSAGQTGLFTPNGVQRPSYPGKQDVETRQSAPTGLTSCKSETTEEHEPKAFPEEEEEEEPPTVERNAVLVGADDVLYGEPGTGSHVDDTAAPQETDKQEKKLSWEKIKPYLRPLTVNIKSPCSVVITAAKSHQDSSGSDGTKMVNGSVVPPVPVRQPLKRKNELSDQPSNMKDSRSQGATPCSVDLTAYKPMNFESSFLNFIQQNPSIEKPVPIVKHRDSVKENNQLGVPQNHSRHTHASAKPHAANISPSVLKLKSIMDKALTGCGDMAIKQLQYLRPVVVLGKPVCTATFTPSDKTNGNLALGS